MKNGYVSKHIFESSPHLKTKSVDLLAKLLDSSLDVICSIDEEGYFVTVSAASRQVWGYEPEELEGKPYMDLVVEEDHPKTQNAAASIMSGMNVTNFENRYKRKDGTIIPIVWSARWDSKDHIMYCVARDGSEKQQSDAKIKKANRRARTHARKVTEILASMQDGFFSMDAEWRVTYFNQEAERLTGKTREEMIGRVFWEVFPSAVNGIAYKEYHRAIQEQVQVNFEVYSQLYNAWYDVTAYPSKTGISVYFKNISLRKLQEEEIKTSNQRYELLAKATSDAVWDWDLQTNQCYFSEAFNTLFGYKEKADDIYDIWVNNIYLDDKELVFESVQRALDNPKVNQWEGEYRFCRANQSVAYVLDRSFIIRDDTGKAVRMVGSMQDISRLRQAEDELQTLSLIAKETGNAVVLTDAEERITWVNKAFTEITEYTFDEVKGKKPNEFLQGANTSPKMKAYMREQVKRALPFSCEIINYSKSGREYWMEVKGQPIFNDKGEVVKFFSIQTDVTERVALQKMIVEEKILVQQQITKAVIETQEKERTEIAKELHDNVSQIMATVKLYLDNIRHLPEHRDLFTSKSIELTELAIKETRDLAHQLITPVISDLGFKDAIEELLSHYRNLRLFDVNFQFTICEDKINKHIRLTIYRIVQECLNNVVKYAKAANVYVGLVYEDNLVKVIVQDDGIGFDVNEKGKGIGMTNIRNRASLYNGKLYIESEKGAGTKLSVHFSTVNDEIVKNQTKSNLL